MEPSREEMDDAVRWMRELLRQPETEAPSSAWLDDLFRKDALAIIAYIDLLEKRVRELGGGP